MAITNGYLTVAELKAHLSITDSGDDALLEDIVSDVSREIDEECGTRFYAVSETRYFTAVESHRILLPVGSDLLSVDVNGLKTDEDGDRTYEKTWATTDFDLLPYNAQLGSTPRPYWEIRVTPEGDYSFPVGVEKGVQIAGSWGFASSAPRIVKRACRYQCALEYYARNAPLGSTGSGEFETEVRGIGLHPFVKRMLERVSWGRAA